MATIMDFQAHKNWLAERAELERVRVLAAEALDRAVTLDEVRRFRDENPRGFDALSRQAA